MEAKSQPVWRRDGGVEVHPVTTDRWGDLVDLFERTGPRGGIPIPGGCWCVYWQGGSQGGRAQRKADMKACIEADHIPGLLAYLDDRPVGWIAVAPRKDLVRLERSRQYGPCPGDQDVFAITCFYVDRAVRGQGISSMLLEAAIEYARSSGAAAVDAFPKIDLATHAVGNRRAEENYSYMGRREQYQTRGFTTIREAGKRAVMRLALVPDGR
jgi:GNAT superfamily N-acetyltransferase